MITIGLADDEPLFTAGLAMILEAQDDMCVRWTAMDGQDAIRQHRREAPDVLLLDIQMPGTDGLAVTRELIAQDAATRIVILTTFDANEYVLSAVEAGAAGFLLKNTPPERLLESIRTVHAGDAVISPGPTRRLFATFRAQPARGSAAADAERWSSVLTQREMEVLALAASGLTNQEVCERLHLSMPTVKTHIGNLMSKTHSRDRVQLVLLALRIGVVDVDAL